MLGFAEGKLEKLTIYSCQDKEYKIEKDKYQALINPQDYSESYKIEYSEGKKAANEKEGEKKFNRIPPQTLNLRFVFDSTGVFSNEISFGTNLLSTKKPESVPDQIGRFMKVVYNYDGKVHEPGYVKIVWGHKAPKDLFKGRLDKVEIKYTLFDPSGTPLRAIANATFTASIDKKTEAKTTNKSSPDLTHVRTVIQGDKLPFLTHKIYGDARYYLEVARVNKLMNFRKLPVGLKIYFPPLDKKIA